MQHYDRRGQHEVAVAKIDEAIEHTPTVIDLYSVKVCLSPLNLCIFIAFIVFFMYATFLMSAPLIV